MPGAKKKWYVFSLILYFERNERAAPLPPCPVSVRSDLTIHDARHAAGRGIISTRARVLQNGLSFGYFVLY